MRGMEIKLETKRGGIGDLMQGFYKTIFQNASYTIHSNTMSPITKEYKTG